LGGASWLRGAGGPAQTRLQDPPRRRDGQGDGPVVAEARRPAAALPPAPQPVQLTGAKL